MHSDSLEKLGGSSEGFRIHPVRLNSSVRVGDSIAVLFEESLASQEIRPEADDVLVIAHKIVSKAEGSVVDLRKVTPSERARNWASRHKKDPRVIQVILDQAVRIVKMENGVIIGQTVHGIVCANCGVDRSNTGSRDHVVLLPRNPDLSAENIRQEIHQNFGVRVACIVSDTVGRPWRLGQINVAIGLAGLSPLLDLRGQLDAFGDTLESSILSTADELAAAAGLAMGKALRTPFVIIRGYRFQKDEEAAARNIIRPVREDLFR